MTRRPLMEKPTRALLAASIGLAWTTSCATTFESADIEPTPQRPRVSRNTRTVLEDSVELESGIHFDPNDFVDAPVTVKFGVTNSIESFIEAAPIRHLDLPGGSETGIGDLAFGLRHRFRDADEGGRAYAYELVGKIPTSDEPDGRGTGGRDLRLPGFNSGGTDVRLAGIVEQPGTKMDLVGYGALNALGSPAGGTIYQLLLATHGALPISDADTLFVEAVGAFTEGQDGELFVQGGLYRRIAASMTADVAVGVGLDDEAPAFFLMLGLTTNFGHLR